ncbi:DUF5719 family protein [Tropheryma whipplei]|uniref:DUF5719 family protein n=1 Tax=Tropheryma whipplei TaxID=2039 RepID=UPI0004B4A4B0|nr:DUF5719 family protein [Tropheryma whipplei]
MKIFPKILNCFILVLLPAIVFLFSGVHITTAVGVRHKTKVTSIELRLSCPGSLVGVGGVHARGISFVPLGNPSVLYAASQAGLLKAEHPSGVMLRGGYGTSGSQIQGLSSDRVKGLAAASCQQPRQESWLLGGATGVFDNTLLILGNPSDSQTSVSFTVYSGNEKKFSSGVPVPSRSLRFVNLAGIAPGLSRIAVQVKSDDVPVYSVLQHSIVKGAVPMGVSYVSTGNIDKSQYIPGVIINDNTINDNDNPQILLRLFVPGKDDADVSVSVVSKTTPGTALTAHVTGGSIRDIPISGLTSSSYFISITSSKPLLASALSSMSFQSGARDFAWYPATHATSADTFIAVPSRGVLALQNTLDQSQSVKLESLNGFSDSFPSGFVNTSHVFVPKQPEVTNSTVIHLDRSGVATHPVSRGFYRLSHKGQVAFSLAFINSEGIAMYNPPTGDTRPDGITVDVLQ